MMSGLRSIGPLRRPATASWAPGSAGSLPRSGLHCLCLRNTGAGSRSRSPLCGRVNYSIPQEISLLDARGHIAWHTRGDMPTMKDSFARALARAQREGLADAEYHALYGQIVYFATNGDYLHAVATVKQLGTVLGSIGDPRAIVTHRRLSAVASTFAGDHTSAGRRAVRARSSKQHVRQNACQRNVFRSANFFADNAFAHALAAGIS